MWNGKKKAITFSYDDGVTQDKRLIEIFNRYGLKGTFNLNSGLLGGKSDENRINVKPEEVRSVYEGHEVAVHTVTHPNLTQLEEAEILQQVNDDKKRLEELVGYSICGMAYPCGGVNNDERVASIIKEKTEIKYSRTIKSTFEFKPQENLLRFNPTVYHLEFDDMFKLAEEFLSSNDDEPKLFYIWGHSYEFDSVFPESAITEPWRSFMEKSSDSRWSAMEDFCKMISGKDDVFYGTNREVLLHNK